MTIEKCFHKNELKSSKLHKGIFNASWVTLPKPGLHFLASCKSLKSESQSASSDSPKALYDRYLTPRVRPSEVGGTVFAPTLFEQLSQKKIRNNYDSILQHLRVTRSDLKIVN